MKSLICKQFSHGQAKKNVFNSFYSLPIAEPARFKNEKKKIKRRSFNDEEANCDSSDDISVVTESKKLADSRNTANKNKRTKEILYKYLSPRCW